MIIVLMGIIGLLTIPAKTMEIETREVIDLSRISTRSFLLLELRKPKSYISLLEKGFSITNYPEKLTPLWKGFLVEILSSKKLGVLDGVLDLRGLKEEEQDLFTHAMGFASSLVQEIQKNVQCIQTKEWTHYLPPFDKIPQ